MPFLPVSLKEAKERGWETVDAVCVTGDAYVDHPSFGIAIISRVIENMGYSVGIIAQPDLKNPDAFKVFGKPRLAFFITSGNIDSMVMNYTVAKKKRNDDVYSAGGKAGKRPDRALALYCKAARKAYPDVPIIIGGLEASLRRFAHYDYWSDKVRPSIMVDTGADLMTYGMGERATREVVRRLAAGEKCETMTDIRGTCFLSEWREFPEGVSCASFEKVAADKTAYARAFKMQMDEQDHVYGRTVVQKQGENLCLVQNPPAAPLERDELDEVYAMSFMRADHPQYEALGGVPAIKEVEFSITHNRGCFGGCNFCAITSHQGRYVTSRSPESIIEEAKKLTLSPHFKGYIHDVGGPTANFSAPACAKQKKYGVCKGKKCLAPTACHALSVDHTEYLGILRALRALPGVKGVFVRSGIRFDYLLKDKSEEFFKDLVRHHVSGHLKVAPEHCSARVLDLMGKPHIEVYDRFAKRFYELTKEAGKEQYLVPYMISSHPGSELSDAVKLAVYMKRNRMRPEQVQDFYPTPMTASTCMYYTGLDPATMKPVYVARTPEEKAMQRALLQYYKPENRDTVIKALRMTGYTSLIGNGPDCLVNCGAGASPEALAKNGKNRRKGNRYGKCKQKEKLKR